MSTLVIIPGSPALVRELAPSDAAGAQLLDHARTALWQAAVKLRANDGAEHVRVPVDLVCSQAPRWRTEHAGSFAAWGAPHVRVSAGHYLAELVARYVTEPVDGVEVRAVREHLTAPDPQAITVVVVDGSAGLDARAPLAELPAAAAVHQWCCELLRGGVNTYPPEWDAGQLSEAGIVEPEPWLELAEYASRRGLRAAELLAADDSLGVGRYVARWEVA
ncbi:hypothetical protein ACEE23_05930 [Corynebacterium sp. 32222D000AT]|uniref:hypothetical protein n=1 Tax=unclassified Corynebacterium TaxID=2624378 RepID=UPI002A9EEAB0|nr:hypothetical protein [Mycobacteriaceae bacterium]MDY5828561.1 hypothetical protein [Corynebacterium sp.]